MMSQAEWWELAVEALRDGSMDVRRLGQIYVTEEVHPKASREEILGYLADIEKRLRGETAPYMVMAAGDWVIRTPDDLWMEPAWNPLEVGILWDRHDGRSYGTMVVAVYKLDEEGVYKRDTSWGLLGNAGKTGPAQYPDDQLCSE